MAVENFTTWTAAGDQIADVTITATKCDADLTEQDAARVYKDKGAGQIGAAFEHKFEITWQSIDAGHSPYWMFSWAVSDDDDDAAEWVSTHDAFGLGTVGTSSPIPYFYDAQANEIRAMSSALTATTKYYATATRQASVTITSAKVSCAFTEQNEIWVYNDEGAGNIGTAFTHQCDVTVWRYDKDHSGYRSHVWAVSNVINDDVYWDTNNSQAYGISWQPGTANTPALRLEDFPNSTSDASALLAVGTKYYLKIIRSNGGNTLACEIWDTAARDSVLIDTISEAIAATTLRYVFAANSRDEAAGDDAPIVYDVETFSLDGGSTTEDFTAWDGAGGGDASGNTLIDIALYSDSGRTPSNLVACDGKTVVATNTFQYVYAVNSRDEAGGGNATSEYDVENMDLNEAAAPPSFIPQPMFY